MLPAKVYCPQKNAARGNVPPKYTVNYHPYSRGRVQVILTKYEFRLMTVDMDLSVWKLSVCFWRIIYLHIKNYCWVELWEKKNGTLQHRLNIIRVDLLCLNDITYLTFTKVNCAEKKINNFMKRNLNLNKITRLFAKIPLYVHYMYTLKFKRHQKKINL